MRTTEQLEHELDSLIRQNYYAEDYELRWILKRFEAGLAAGERERLHAIVLGRMVDDASILNVMLCSASRVPEAVPILASVLDRQPEADMLTRAILSTLGDYGDPSAFSSVERFLDSDQEAEALLCLARLHFTRALFFVIRAARRAHLRDVCLQVLHERKKRVGLVRLIDELTEHARGSRQNVFKRVQATLRTKDDPYNPFDAEEREAILAGLRR
jgi:hypothetical protein